MRLHNGTVSPVGYDIAEPDAATLARWWPKIECVGECMEWRAGVRKDGYGVFSMRRRDGKYRMRAAHRVSYEMFVGPIPEDYDIDHLCRNRRSVRPQHLEPVRRLENLRRGQTIVAKQMAVTHCPQGHPYDEANTVWYRTKRQCRACTNARQRERWSRNMDDPAFREREQARAKRRWQESKHAT